MFKTRLVPSIILLGGLYGCSLSDERFKIEGVSMESTLFSGDVVYIQKDKELLETIDRFDIVVYNKDGKNIIKRVVGLPNETVTYVEGKGYIDKAEMEEHYLKDEKGLTEDFQLTSTGDCYILLGDNRRMSKDSRSVGCIEKKYIIGKVKMK